MKNQHCKGDEANTINSS